MTSRRKQQNMEKENQRTAVAQSPKELSNESVDDLLANVDSFIEGVYRDLSVSPPSRPMGLRRSLNDSSVSSICSPNSSPAGAASLTNTTFDDDAIAVVSPPTRRNMEAEIARIYGICDDVDQNLRSIGVFMNNTPTVDDVLNSNLTNSPSSSTSSMMALSINSPPTTTEARVQNTERGRPRRRRSPVQSEAAHVIDLSDSQIQTPEFRRHTVSGINNYNHNSDDDDDVILVSDIHPVVDLCTPGGHQEQANVRPSINRRELNRRRLSQKEEDTRDSCSQGPSTARKRRTSLEYKDTSSESAPGPTPFMCPVCMESCLHRQPTSTRCGHVYCKECIEQAMRVTHKCPMCNSKITKSQIFRIYL